MQEEKENINALIKKNKIENNIKEKNGNGEKNIDIRKLSWNEAISNNDNINEDKKNKNTINEENEKEWELMLESGRVRSNRAMTIQKSSYNFGEVISNLRKRRERLAILNKKIKKDSS